MNTELTTQLDEALDAVRAVAHGHFNNNAVRLRLELAAAHLRAAYRIAAHGKADPSDDADHTHRAVMRFQRLMDTLDAARRR